MPDKNVRNIYMENATFYDLELMKGATNYSKWIFSLLKPFLSGKILEIGSGTGNITRWVIDNCKNIQSLSCIEPNIECLKELEKIIEKSDNDISINIYNVDFVEFMVHEKFDVIFAVNVLEHIHSDVSALGKIHSLLRKEGKVLLFVPAFPCLYGSTDKELGHYRRYKKRELKNKLIKNHFLVSSIRYYNVIGFLGWLFNNKLLKKRTQSPTQIWIFDKIILPIASKIEATFACPFGQSLFCVAIKA